MILFILLEMPMQWTETWRFYVKNIGITMQWNIMILLVYLIYALYDVICIPTIEDKECVLFQNIYKIKMECYFFKTGKSNVTTIEDNYWTQPKI